MLLIGTDEGIYRWAEGNNWPVFHGLQDRAIVSLASPGAGVLAGMDDGGLLWESGDNGLSWRPLDVPDGAGTPVSLAVGGDPPVVVLATRPLRLYLRPVGAPLRTPRPFLTSVVDSFNSLAESAASRVRKRPPAGKGGTAVAARPAKPARGLLGWLKLGQPSSPASKSPDVRLLHLGADAWFASASGAGLFRSVDAGVNWTPVASLPAEVFSIRPIPHAAGSLVAATADGVHTSTDGGLTWGPLGAGFGDNKAVRVVEVRPDNPKYLLAAAGSEVAGGPQGDALFESSDAGKTWARVLRSFPENPRFDRIIDIRFDPAHPDNAAVAFASGELWKTLNGGFYWEPFARQIRGARALCPVG